jgi:hypothetical protein
LVQDTRLQVRSPASLSTVSLPVDLALSWRGGDRPPSFAVFLDRLPVPPGATLRDAVPRSDPCRRTPGCPDQAWLTAHGIFLVGSDHVQIPAVAPVGGTAGRDAPAVHEATIVPLDAAGRRIGEQSTTAMFRVRSDG